MDNIIAENLLLVCSICLDSIADFKERSVAKLTCGRVFHLDCIGSAFNVKGAMVCPNCRQTEAGQWLYGNSSAPPLFDSDFDVDDGNLAELSVQRLLNEVETQYLIDEEPSSGLTREHPSFGQVESSPTPNRELPETYAVSAEHMAASHLAHSHVHVPPFPGAISGASASVDNPISSHHGQSGRIELGNLNPFHAANLQYQGWGHYSTPISAEGNHLNGVDNISVPSTFGTARVDSAAISRPGPYVLLSIYGYTSFPSGRSLFVSSLNHPGSITYPHERMQGSHAGHPTQHSPTIVILPILPGVSRFGAPTRLHLLAPTLHSASPPQGGSSIFPHSAGQDLHEQNMGHFSRFRFMLSDRDSGSGSQRHVSDRAEPSHRSGNFWLQ